MYDTHNYLEWKNDMKELHSLPQEVNHLKLQILKLTGSLKIQQDLMNSRLHIEKQFETLLFILQYLYRTGFHC